MAIHSALLCQEMIIVGDGRPTAHAGGAVWNPRTDDISDDEVGLATVRNLGRRVAEVALKRAPAESGPAGSGLPVLVAPGAGQCIPCKQMQPDLNALKENYSGAMELVYIDVWQDRAAGARYGIQSIPTQIFYDASGRELFRHAGYYSKDDILAKWQELGIPLQPDTAATSPDAG